MSLVAVPQLQCSIVLNCWIDFEMNLVAPRQQCFIVVVDLAETAVLNFRNNNNVLVERSLNITTRV